MMYEFWVGGFWKIGYHVTFLTIGLKMEQGEGGVLNTSMILHTVIGTSVLTKPILC